MNEKTGKKNTGHLTEGVVLPPTSVKTSMPNAEPPKAQPPQAKHSTGTPIKDSQKS